MKLKPIFILLLVLAGLILSAFGSLPSVNSAGQSSANQVTATVPPVVETVIVPGTVVVPVTAVVPVTGTGGPTGWTLIIYGLLVLMGITLLLSLFAPRRTHDHVVDHNHDHTNPPSDV
jgi:hypothetical protein